MNIHQLTPHERERFDFAVIAHWIPPGERVLDVALETAFLFDEKGLSN